MAENKDADLIDLGLNTPNKHLKSNEITGEAEADTEKEHEDLNRAAEDSASAGMKRQQRDDPTIFTK